MLDTSGGGTAVLDISQTTAGASIAALVDTAPGAIVNLGARTLTLTGTFSAFGGVIKDGGIASGTGGGLVIGANAGAVLAGANTFTGATEIRDNGYLALEFVGTLAHSSGINLSGPGATFDISCGCMTSQTIKDLSGVGTSRVLLGNTNLTVGTANSTTFAGVISDAGGNGGLVKQGSGTLTLSGANTYVGGTTLNAGALAVGHNSALGTGTLSFANNTTLQAAANGLSLANAMTLNGAGTIDTQANSMTLVGGIDGPGSLTKIGSGTLTLTGTNSYTGGTTLNAGVLAVGDNSALGTGTLTFANTTTLQAATDGLSLANAMTLNGAATIDTQSSSMAIAGGIDGPGSLSKIGAGTLTLSAANTYSGATTLNAGTLALSGAGGISSSSSVTVGSGATFDISGLGTGSGTQITTLAGSGLVQLGGSGLFLTNASTTFSGTIAGTGTTSTGLSIDTGTLTLTGANSYSSSTVIAAGATLALSGGGSISSSFRVQFGPGGTATLDISQTTSGATVGGLTSTTAGNVVSLGSKTLTVATNGGTFNGVIQDGGLGSGSGGGFAITGAANQSLGGVNTYTGATTVGAGSQLFLTGAGSIAASSGVNLTGAGATFFLSSGSPGKTIQDLAGVAGSSVDLNDTTLTVGTANSTSFAGSITGTGGGLVKVGSGTLILTGANSYTGGTTVSGGTLQGNTASLQGNIVNNAVVAFGQSGNGIYAGNMSGSGALTVTGGGNVTLSGTNTYAGGTTVSAGTLTGTTTSVQGAITNNAAVVFDQATSGTYAGVMSGTGSLTKTGSGTVILTNDNSYGGGTTINGGVLQLGNGGTSGSITGNVVVNGADSLLAFNRSDTVTFAGDISGAGGIMLMGPGTVKLTGNNTFTGGTAIGGGIVQASSDAAFGAAGTTLRIGGGATVQALASFISDRAVSLLAMGGTFDTGDNTLTLQGPITGVGSLTKTGAGTLILTGANSYGGGTTVEAGTVQGNTTSLQGAIVNNATVVFDQGTSGTYAGVMSGTGALIKTGAGNLTLTAANSYIGGTTVSGGTLTGNTTSLQGNITNNATVAFDQATNGTYGGILSGLGALVKSGTGNLTLTGANSYAGGTTVNGGTLTGTTSSLQGSILNNATVAFNQGANGTYGGAMSGSGALVKNGTGALTLAGINTYGGGTTVNAGVLIGNNLSLQGNILNNAALVFDQASDGTYGGTLTGSGSLTKSGAGRLVLTGANVMGGGTTVSGGTLAVNGSLASNVTVGTGGVLGGIGQVIGAVAVSGGTLAPGNSIGTLNVTRNFSQTGGVYQVEANSQGQSDKIVATGTATLSGGTTVQVLAQSGSYQRNTTYTILTATGGLTGTYGSVMANLAFLTPTLSYDANNVYLLLAQTASAFASGAQTPNQYAVGTALDIASPTATGDFATVLNALAALTTQQGPAALDAISGQPYTGFGTVNVLAARSFLNVVGQQTANARVGADGAQRVALAEACVIACDTQEPPRWGAWMSGYGGVGGIGGNSNAGALNYNFGGAAVGVDYRLDPRFLVGLAIGYSSGRQWVGSFQGTGWTDNYSVALYASFAQGGFYADALAGYAYSDNRQQRVLSIPGLATRYANGATGANMFLGQIEAGYKIGLHDAARASLTPFARFQTVAAAQRAFTEWGADSLNLMAQQQNTTSVRTILGADLAASLPLGDRTLDVAMRLGWAHEYADTGRPLTASFVGASTVPFTVYGAQPLRDAAVIGLNLGTRITDSISAYVRYDGELNGRDDTHAFSAGFRMTW